MNHMHLLQADVSLPSVCFVNHTSSVSIYHSCRQPQHPASPIPYACRLFNDPKAVLMAIAIKARIDRIQDLMYSRPSITRDHGIAPLTLLGNIPAPVSFLHVPFCGSQTLSSTRVKCCALSKSAKWTSMYQYIGFYRSSYSSTVEWT